MAIFFRGIAGTGRPASNVSIVDVSTSPSGPPSCGPACVAMKAADNVPMLVPTQPHRDIGLLLEPGNDGLRIRKHALVFGGSPPRKGAIW